MKILTQSRRPQGEAIHIYTISRVFRKNAPTWESMLRELERDRNFMRSVYAPVRAGINLEIRSPGRGEAAMERSLRELSNMKHFDTICTVSRAAFAAFRDLVLPQIEAIEEDYVNRPGGTNRFQFGDFELEGSFHAKVRCKSGGVRYIYLHPSQWDGDATAAFVELLTIMGEKVYGATRDEIWFIDLREQKIQVPGKNFKALRKELLATVTHLARLRKVSLR